MKVARGFTLIEIVVVILVVAVLIAMAAALTRGVAAAQKRSLTATRMAAVDAALVQFVQQQRRLPCPADGTVPSPNNNVGIEGARNAAGCTGNLQNGVLPWRALGLTETESSDGWDRRFTYRLQPALGGDNAMDMSWCDPAGTGGLVGTGCNPACTSAALASCTPPQTFLQGKGLQVRKIDGATVLMEPAPVAPAPHTGAAYVVISHGETGGGAMLYSGSLSVSTVADGNQEQLNYADRAFVAGATYYVDDSIVDVGGAGHFDDVVSRPTLLSVIAKAGLGPRSH